MQTQEIWAKCPILPSHYEVSTLGKIRYWKSNKWNLKITKTCIHGYEVAMVYMKGKYEFIKVHKIVALTFIPNINNLPQIHHINENKKDNRSINLTWISCANNLKEHALLSQFPIYQIDKDGNVVGHYQNFYEASELTGIPYSKIRDCANNKLLKAGEFIFCKEKPQMDDIIKAFFFGKYQVAKYDKEGELLEVYKNASYAAYKNGINKKAISYCIKGSQKTAGGYVYKKYIVSE